MSDIFGCIYTNYFLVCRSASQGYEIHWWPYDPQWRSRQGIRRQGCPPRPAPSRSVSNSVSRTRFLCWLSQLRCSLYVLGPISPVKTLELISSAYVLLPYEIIWNHCKKRPMVFSFLFWECRPVFVRISPASLPILCCDEVPFSLPDFQCFPSQNTRAFWFSRICLLSRCARHQGQDYVAMGPYWQDGTQAPTSRQCQHCGAQGGDQPSTALQWI